MNKFSLIAVATGAALQFFAAAPALAQERADEAYSEITEAFGFVPTFMREYPEHGIAGAWILTRDLELSEETALSPKIKALINVAVGAQIPCRYCVYVDTLTAKSHGASDEEIKEAVAQAGLTRHWSTILNGLQIDFEEFKAEFGG
jgi:AhpD family alkylhydroperoxidase